MTKISDFQVTKKLGDGAFSSVYLAKRISDGAAYAILQKALMYGDHLQMQVLQNKSYN